MDQGEELQVEENHEMGTVPFQVEEVAHSAYLVEACHESAAVVSALPAPSVSFPRLSTSALTLLLHAWFLSTPSPLLEHLTSFHEPFSHLPQSVI